MSGKEPALIGQILHSFFFPDDLFNYKWFYLELIYASIFMNHHQRPLKHIWMNNFHIFYLQATLFLFSIHFWLKR